MSAVCRGRIPRCRSPLPLSAELNHHGQCEVTTVEGPLEHIRDDGALVLCALHDSSSR